MKTKKSTRIIALILVAVTVVGLVAGGLASSAGSNATATVLDVLSPKPRVTQAQVEKAVANNVDKDYTLASMINALGYPGAIMIDYDGVNVFNYAEDKDIKQLLDTYKEDERLTANSLIQLMWLDESENLIFSFIALEYNTPTVVGVIMQTLKDVTKGAKHIPTTTATLKDFDKYDEETLNALGESYTTSIQYPLLECNYTKKNLSNSNLNSVWTTKVVQNKQGLMYILLQDGKPYQLYQEYDKKDVPTYDKAEKLWTGLNERQFLNEYPDAMRIQLFNYVENETDYFIISYVVNEKNNKGEVNEVVYNIVGGDLYVYDEKGELVTNNSGLIIEGNGGATTESEDTTEPTESVESTEESTEPSESTEPTEALDATESP